MNERIRELARQSGLVQYDTDSKMQDAERFAELIVQECASIIESQDVDPAFRHRMAWAVKQRFGVKQ